MTDSKAQRDGPQLLVVSNRLPLSIKPTDGGEYEAHMSGGGLVSSLSGISGSIPFQWFGWPGIEIPESEVDGVKQLLQKYDAVPVLFGEELADRHYNGFSSKCRNHPTCMPYTPVANIPATSLIQIPSYGQFSIISRISKTIKKTGGRRIRR